MGIFDFFRKKVYSFTNSKGETYYLNSKVETDFAGSISTSYYFTKDVRSSGCDLPKGKVVYEDPSTELPQIKKSGIKVVNSNGQIIYEDPVTGLTIIEQSESKVPAKKHLEIKNKQTLTQRRIKRKVIM